MHDEAVAVQALVQLAGPTLVPPFLCSAGAAFEGSLQYDLPSERQTVMQQTAASSGQTLRELAGAAPAPADPRQAAIEAALRRVELSAAADGLGSQQQQLQAQAQQQQQVFSKGQRVLYRQRDGALEEATVSSRHCSCTMPALLCRGLPPTLLGANPAALPRCCPAAAPPPPPVAGGVG